MSETVDTIVESLCRQSYNKVYEVYEVFKDFFDEERVDLIGINYAEIVERLKTRTYSSFINTSAIMSNALYSASSDHIKSIIKTLISEKALETRIGEDATVFKYFLPYLTEGIQQYVNRLEAQILVHFPEVRVSNEHDKYVDIKELYARVKLSGNGTIIGTFGLFRADYPLSHLYADYAHSHISGVTLNENEFKSPCLGNGPIISTISSLTRDCDLNFWMLFCRELDTYVTVESLVGGPYRRMENITGTRRLRLATADFSSTLHNRPLSSQLRGEIPEDTIKAFIKHLLKTKAIKFGFSNGSYILAMGYKDMLISMSNCFIDFINNYMERDLLNTMVFTVENLERKNILMPYVIKNGQIYTFTRVNYSTTSYMSYNDKKVLSFKGKDIKLNIYDDTVGESDENTVRLLNSSFCEFLVFKMINYLNIVYGSNNPTTEIRSRKKCLVL